MIHLILALIFLFTIARLITRPFRFGRSYRRSAFGNSNPYRYGCRRHHRVLGGLLPILALVAIDRLFGRRF